jgi:protein disulfide-isomerase
MRYPRAVTILGLSIMLASCGGPGGSAKQTTAQPAAAGPRAAAVDKSGAWSERASEALALAKRTGLPVLADFTGSDWCFACKQLKLEVFDTKEFKDWATTHVVLLEVDFPSGHEQPAELAAQNAELAKRFSIEGFPTVLALDGDGRRLGALVGYAPGTGPTVWIAQFAKLVDAPGR